MDCESGERAALDRSEAPSSPLLPLLPHLFLATRWMAEQDSGATAADSYRGKEEGKNYENDGGQESSSSSEQREFLFSSKGRLPWRLVLCICGFATFWKRWGVDNKLLSQVDGWKEREAMHEADTGVVRVCN